MGANVLILRGLLPILSLALLGGCASIVGGTSQSLSVQTTSDGTALSGAQCDLKNDKGTWFVTTPGTVTVHRSYDALNVKCTHDGYTPVVVTDASSTKGMAFGNILFGGLIGAAIDVSDGAAYVYPALITVPMSPQPSVSMIPKTTAAGPPTS
ncbi:MAG: hypothetical protein ACRDTO_14655 [Mycobacterium sp.]